AVPPRARPGDRAIDARRDSPRRVLQDRRVLLDVRAEVLLDAHQPRRRAMERQARGRQEGRQAHSRDLRAVTAAPRARFALLACATALLCAACNGCNKGGSATAPGASAKIAALLPADASAPERAPEVDDMWARAKDGEEDDLVRLARREGVLG